MKFKQVTKLAKVMEVMVALAGKFKSLVDMA